MIYDLDNSDRALLAICAAQAVHDKEGNSVYFLDPKQGWDTLFPDTDMGVEVAQSIMDSVVANEYSQIL